MDLKLVLDKQAKWARGEDGGERADLRGADLHGANLCGANLCDANLRHANLSDTNLYRANLSDTNLYRADLRGANLRGANLSDADLRHADLRDADLRDADLRHAKKSIKLNGICTRPFTHCSVLRLDHLPGIKMLAAAKRSSATSRKCRHSKAKVLGITNMDGILTRTAGMNARQVYIFLSRAKKR